MALERGKSQLFLPDWKVIHDMADTEGNHGLGKLSDEGIKRVYTQLRKVGGDAGRWTSFESFSEWWREQEAKHPRRFDIRVLSAVIYFFCNAVGPRSPTTISE